MEHIVIVEIPNSDNIILELTDEYSKRTADLFIKSLPFETKLHLWDQEIYTDPTKINTEEENAKPVVDLFDVAYWPSGKAVCLFYGPTPISTKNQIKPYSPVNIIGKIKNPDKKILSRIQDGTKATFRLK